MARAWVSSYCLNIESFSRILHATLQKLGVRDHPEYEGQEYEEHGTEWRYQWLRQALLIKVERSVILARSARVPARGHYE